MPRFDRAKASASVSAPIRRKRGWAWLILITLALLGGAGVAGLYFLNSLGITPRSLGPYIERRSAGHNSVILGIGQTARELLVRVDRGVQPHGRAMWESSIGVQDGGGVVPDGQEVLVFDSAGMVRAIAAASPGQVITMLPGRYHIDRMVEAFRPGTKDAPIIVRAVEPGSVELEIATREGFRISAPYWRFENLQLRGICDKSSVCEHAFHVVGNAHHFAAVNNLIVDFDAHIKINGERGRFPDHGLLESNTLRNTSIRVTEGPVTPVDLVTASHWIIRRNLVSDFIKGAGNRVSYGMFAKGAGSNNLLEQNIVVCEDKLRGAPGQRVGLSLGGGGTGKSYCRDGKCVAEQYNSTLRANLIASCSDDGIHLNAAARSKLVHNTLLDTGGITVRFPESSADIDGNLVDGLIRSRDNGIVRLADNRYTGAARLYIGSHPHRVLFQDSLALDFRWREPAERRVSPLDGDPVPDLCNIVRPSRPRYGAFEDFANCLSPQTALRTVDNEQ